MGTKRPYYPTKAAWARAEAKALRDQAFALPTVSRHNWRGVRRRAEGQSRLLAEAARFDRMAERFEARGL